MKRLIAVMGDVHHLLPLALETLSHLEQERCESISQIFSVGDLGLFLAESDWSFLTGPSKHRKPEDSPALRACWEKWRWPTSIIGGNHEPFTHLRRWDPSYFESKLEYTHAGRMTHTISGLNVYGLTGIYHPESLHFVSKDLRKAGIRPQSWSDLVDLVEKKQVSSSLLTYYKESELNSLKHLPKHPHLLITHDWPAKPDHIQFEHPQRPERDLSHHLQPQFHCCGHHHTVKGFELGKTQVRASNIITTKEKFFRHRINEGWLWLFHWDDATKSVNEIGFWPSHG